MSFPNEDFGNNPSYETPTSFRITSELLRLSDCLQHVPPCEFHCSRFRCTVKLSLLQPLLTPYSGTHAPAQEQPVKQRENRKGRDEAEAPRSDGLGAIEHYVNPPKQERISPATP